MADILRGTPVAAVVSKRASARADALRARGITPKLLIIRVGDRPDDAAYERNAMRRLAKTGVEAEAVTLREDDSQEKLMAQINRVNQDASIHGALLFRPLPLGFDENAVMSALSPDKDVDGMTHGSMAGVFLGVERGFAPCTAQACMELLDYYGVDPAGKAAVVIGRSAVIGKPVAMMLLKRNATVTVCHTKTRDLAAVCRGADILIAAAGKAGVVSAEHLRPCQTVIDVGINVAADGSLSGDVDFESAVAVAGAITPVPGGVGAVTTSVLAHNVTLAAERLNGIVSER